VIKVVLQGEHELSGFDSVSDFLSVWQVGGSILVLVLLLVVMVMVVVVVVVVVVVRGLLLLVVAAVVSLVVMSMEGLEEEDQPSFRPGELEIVSNTIPSTNCCQIP
jgi:hypothetical protein